MAPSRTFLPESRLRPLPDQSSHSRAFDLSSPPLRDLLWPSVARPLPPSAALECPIRMEVIVIWSKGPWNCYYKSQVWILHRSLFSWVHQPPRFTIFTCGFGPSRKFGIKIKWDGMGEKNAKCYVSIRYILTTYLIMNLQIWVVLLNVCPKVVVFLSHTHKWRLSYLFWTLESWSEFEKRMREHIPVWWDGVRLG